MELRVFYHLFANLPLEERENRARVPFDESVETVKDAYFKVRENIRKIQDIEAENERLIDACAPTLQASDAYKNMTL